MAGQISDQRREIRDAHSPLQTARQFAECQRPWHGPFAAIPPLLAASAGCFDHLLLSCFPLSSPPKGGGHWKAAGNGWRFPVALSGKQCWKAASWQPHPLLTEHQKPLP